MKLETWVTVCTDYTCSYFLFSATFEMWVTVCTDYTCSYFIFSASFETWVTVCTDYALQLESEGQYHKAVSYLLAAHKVYDAIELFKKHRLFKFV